MGVFLEINSSFEFILHLMRITSRLMNFISRLISLGFPWSSFQSSLCESENKSEEFSCLFTIRFAMTTVVLLLAFLQAYVLIRMWSIHLHVFSALFGVDWKWCNASVCQQASLTPLQHVNVFTPSVSWKADAKVLLYAIQAKYICMFFWSFFVFRSFELLFRSLPLF